MRRVFRASRPAAAGGDDDFANPPRRTLRVLLLLAGVAVAGVATFLLIRLPDQLDCDGGANLTEQAGECLGVTDGSPAFLPKGGDGLAPQFESVQQLIKDENDRVAGEARTYVKVGLMTMLTPTQDGPLSPERMLRAMEGAYTAQMRANHERQLGDPAPQIQLHLANVGSRHQRWEPAVDRLVAMADDEVPLVAVVGLSISSEDSQAAARELSEHGIPVIAASASADGLNSETIDGLLRVTASNTDFVKALRAYVDDREELDKAVLVFDESAPDLHVRTLTAAFEEQFADEIGVNPAQSFEGETLDEDARAALVDAAVRNVCEMVTGRGVDMVLFSGRTGDLRSFVEALHSRSCRDEPLSVLFVETGPVIEEAEYGGLADHNLTIVQASAMDPAWTEYGGRGPRSPEGFTEFFEQYEEHVGYVSDVATNLEDGYAVANHDALATAVQAIRVSHAQAPEEPVTSSSVQDALFLLHLGNAVDAASGTLHFTQERNGDPGGKPVPILEAPPGATRPELWVTPVP